ncbi:MAG: hypothetical protein R2818_08585 [Flavobacteriales bacterium]
MSGALRSAGLVPLTEPYTAQGYTHVGGGGGETTTSGVLSTTGNSSVVDWVVVSCGVRRIPRRSGHQERTVIAERKRCRSGWCFDVSFSRAAGNYYIALRHRNHLGIMTAQAIALDDSADPLDLSNASVALYNASEATKNIAGVRVLFAGDVTGDGTVRYTGLENDRDRILLRVGGVVPTNTWSGYAEADVNMDGVVSYTGSGNDRDYILVNIGGAAVTSTRSAALP